MAVTMTDGEVRDFLSHGTRTGKLASIALSGQPHVAPIWFMVDDGGPRSWRWSSPPGRSRRRVGPWSDTYAFSLLVDDQRPLFAFVKLTGTVTISEDLDEVGRWAPRIGGRYMGADRGDEFVRRNGVPGELLVRLRPSRLSPSAASPTDAAIAGQAGTAAAKN